MIAHHEIVERQGGRDRRVDCLSRRPVLEAARDVRLIGHTDKEEARPSQRGERLADTRHQLKIFESGERVQPGVPNDRPVQDPVPVQEYGGR